jgi:hypothetical protein
MMVMIKYSYGDQRVTDERDKRCNMQETEKKRLQNFCQQLNNKVPQSDIR